MSMNRWLSILLLVLSQVLPIGWACGQWRTCAGGAPSDKSCCCADHAAPDDETCECSGESPAESNELCGFAGRCGGSGPQHAACGVGQGCSLSGKAPGCACSACPGSGAGERNQNRPLPPQTSPIELAWLGAGRPGCHPLLEELASPGAKGAVVAARLTDAESNLVRARLCCWTI